MAEHKIQSTDITGGEGVKVRPDALGEEEYDNFDSAPAVPRSKRLIVDLYAYPPSSTSAVPILQTQRAPCLYYRHQRPRSQIPQEPGRRLGPGVYGRIL